MESRKSGYFVVYRDVWKHKVFKNLIQLTFNQEIEIRV